MGTEYCYECGHMLSRRLDYCPNCGWSENCDEGLDLLRLEKDFIDISYDEWDMDQSMSQ